MANSAQARKRARQAEKHHKNNTSQRSAMRSSVKKVIYAIESGNKEDAQAAYKTAAPLLDSLVGKGLVHKNKAARHKSRLNNHIKSM